MTRHIGIAACSAEGAALCYRTICVEGAQLLGGHAHPEVSMHTPSLEAYMQRIYRGDWQGVGEMMLASAARLKGMGCDFVVCPDNTLHQALPYVLPRSPLPWLHIAEAVMAEARARGYRRLGLSGTRWLVEGPVYPAELVRPSAAEREEMNRIIMDELVCGGLSQPAGLAFTPDGRLIVAELRTGRLPYIHTKKGLEVANSASPLSVEEMEATVEWLFARQVEALCRPGDLLVLHSTSGASANLLRAAEAARAIGVPVVAFLGRDGGQLAREADVTFVVRSEDTARIQEMHLAVQHIIAGLLDREDLA